LNSKDDIHAPSVPAMWLILTRALHPDAAYWPGRRWFAAVDAVTWPAMWVMLLNEVPLRAGALGLVVTACAIGSGALRLHRAIAMNHRYRFTTWRWGRVLAGLLLFGGLLKLAASLS
jgi:hypothetical protein